MTGREMIRAARNAIEAVVEEAGLGPEQNLSDPVLRKIAGRLVECVLEADEAIPHEAVVAKTKVPVRPYVRKAKIPAIFISSFEHDSQREILEQSR